LKIGSDGQVKKGEEETSAIKMITKVKIVQQNEAKPENNLACPFKKQV
jgi:hypothetical protein